MPRRERVGAYCIAGNGHGALEKELTQREVFQRSHPEGSVSSHDTVDLTPACAVTDFGETTRHMPTKKAASPKS